METKSIIAICLMLAILIFLLTKFHSKKKILTTRFLTTTAIFSAISIILYLVPFLHVSLPIFPNFLELHFDEVPAFIAGFAYGPISAFFVILIKTMAKLPLSTTLGVGELADFIFSICFVVPACLLYRRKRNIKGVLIGFSVSFLAQITISSLLTSFIMLDFYVFVMNIPGESILKMCQIINPAVTSLGWPFLVFVALPFNFIKDILVIVLTLLLYKRLHILIDRISQ